MRLPREIGPIHFVGIGGIGMSGIAEVMLNLGYTCRARTQPIAAMSRGCARQGHQGHDRPQCRECRWRRRCRGHRPRSSADNPELMAARAQRIPVVRRAEMLAEIDAAEMLRRHRRHPRQDDDDDDGRGAARCRRSRSHRRQWRHHQRLWHECATRRGRLDGGRGRRERRHVPEAARDRRGRHQHRSRASRSFYGTFDSDAATRSSDFVENVPFYGFAVLCLDHPEVQAHGRPASRIAASSPMATIRRPTSALVDLARDGRRFALRRRDPRPQHGAPTRDRRSACCRCRASTTPQNALRQPSQSRASSACPTTTIRKALAGFGGVKRRFTRTGEWNGVTVIDDYGHHPVEIAAVLKAARGPTNGQVIAVVQPHRYTRLHDRCSSNSAPASTMPMPSWSRRSIRPARPRSKASTAIISCWACARMAIARWCRSATPPILRQSSRDLQPAATSSSVSVPAASRNGRMRCPAN